MTLQKFELCVFMLRDGSLSCGQTVWDRDPAATMHALDNFTALPDREPSIEYVVEISAAISGHIACVRQERGQDGGVAG